MNGKKLDFIFDAEGQRISLAVNIFLSVKLLEKCSFVSVLDAECIHDYDAKKRKKSWLGVVISTSVRQSFRKKWWAYELHPKRKNASCVSRNHGQPLSEEKQIVSGKITLFDCHVLD